MISITGRGFIYHGSFIVCAGAALEARLWPSFSSGSVKLY